MITTTQTLTINNSVDSDSIKLDFLHLKKAALVLRAMNHKLRQQMIKMLDENQRLTVTEIYVKLR